MNLFSSNPFEIWRRVWRHGTRPLKLLSLVGLLVGFFGFLLTFIFRESYFTERVGQSLLGGFTIIWFFLDTSVRADQQREIEARIERAEQAVVDHPERTRPLWDLARSRLELYFERNLSQIRSIFWITLLVMLAGFTMIAYGILRAFEGDKIQAALIAAGSGILTEFIAATFLIIYRSTMQQASDYVRTLERINAVGMSIQIIDSITETNDDLRSKVRAELGIKILETFGKESKAKP